MNSRARSLLYACLTVPLASWLLVFLVAPLGCVLTYAFLSRGPYGDIAWTLSLENFSRAFDGLYLGIFLDSLGMAALTTAVCLGLGFPMAYCIATARPALRRLLFMLLMVPFLTNFVVRVYAIRALFGAEGPISSLLMVLALRAEPLSLTDSKLTVAIGMITNYLPFMVLPLYVVLEKFDFSLLEAARELGATRWQVVRRVLLPLAKPGMAGGVALVFVPVLGEFMIPDLLGGARTMLLGNLITEQFLKARDWPFGAALATLLVIFAVAFFGVQRLWAPSAPARGGADVART